MGMDKKEFLDKAQEDMYRWNEWPGHLLPDLFLEQIWDTAYQAGRESILKAAAELVHGASELDVTRAIEAMANKQAVDILTTLSDWIEVDPNNRYDVHQNANSASPARKYVVTVWRGAFPEFKNYYGANHNAALADAAQAVMAEVEEARKKK